MLCVFFLVMTPKKLATNVNGNVQLFKNKDYVSH